MDDLCSQLEGLVRELWHSQSIELRWDKSATFPFTNPSLELELRLPQLSDQWIECLGCGEIRGELLQSGERGWAFGIGLERIAMLLFHIEDIRMFWSTDPRFLSQFKSGTISRFVPFSNYPIVTRDVSFWISDNFEATTFFEVARDAAGGELESVRLVDEFTTPGGKRSLCYRLEYRGIDHHLSADEVNSIQARVLSFLSADSRLSLALR